MKSRRKCYDADAKRLMQMSGVEVYEVRDGYGPEHQYYSIVWRGRQRWSISPPWDKNKYILIEVGRSMRRTADMEEAMEKALTRSEVEAEKRKLEDADIHDVMKRDVIRTVVDKPLYFYN
jgi:hypothetical protein